MGGQGVYCTYFRYVACPPRVSSSTPRPRSSTARGPDLSMLAVDRCFFASLGAEMSGIKASEDAIISSSRCVLSVGHIANRVLTTKKLRHAVCALNMLTMALDNRPQFFMGSFQYYDRAISACIFCNRVSASSLLYLHFILLLYDTCCASRTLTHEKPIWAQHYDRLAQLAYNDCTIDQAQAQVLWLTLHLDVQSCLAGNLESGSFVRAYTLHGSRLPSWQSLETLPERCDIGSSDLAALASCLTSTTLSVPSLPSSVSWR